MPLECAIICLDNSEYMRNGDYIPTRLEAQYDAATMLCSAVLNGNPESSAGIITHGGSRVEVKQSPTDDNGKILASLHGIKAEGEGHLLKCVKIAMLALKHRKNKNGSKRIIVFVGSPVTDAPIKLKKLAAQLKKNNIDLDIISMGENADNAESLETMVKTAGDNSHLVDIPPGVYPTEVLASSAIVGGGGGGGGGGAAGFGGVDPDMDPELAMVMQASLAEARAAAGGGDGAGDTAGGGGGGGVGGAGGDDAMTEDEMLQRAMALSMMDSEPAAAPAPADLPAAAPVSAGETASADASSAPAAPAASTSDAPTTPTTARADEAAGSSDAAATADAAGVQDPDFMASLLAGLPGVDVNDPSIQAALASMGGGNAGTDADAGKDADDAKDDESGK